MTHILKKTLQVCVHTNNDQTHVFLHLSSFFSTVLKKALQSGKCPNCNDEMYGIVSLRDA